MPTVKQHKARAEVLKRERWNFESLWQNTAEVVYPRSNRFLGDRTPGEMFGGRLYDSTAVHANSLLAAGLNGMLTNMASEWFLLRIPDMVLESRDEVKRWLFETTEAMRDEMNSPKAGFQTALNEVYLEFGAFGTAMVGAFDDIENNSIRYEARPLSEMYIAENRRGIIDTFYRPFTWTVRQVVQKWSVKNVSESTRKSFLKGDFEEKVKILHVIQPRSDFDTRLGNSSKRNMAIESTYMEIDQNHFLEEGGFKEQALFGPRFAKAAGEVYGRGPGTMALPDARMLNQMARTSIRASMKVVDPPIFVPDDGMISPLRMVPGGANVYRTGFGDKIFPFETKGRPDIGHQDMALLQGRIREMFFVDQLQLGTGPQMTATEVLQRTEEKLRLMGPLLGRVQSELLGPMIERTFSVLSRAGKLPEIPGILLGKNFSIEYVSPIAKAQKQLQASGFMRMMEIIAPIAQLEPSIMDRLKSEEVMQWAGIDLYNMPPKLFRSDREVEDIRDQREQAEQMNQAAELAQKGGQAAQSFAQAQATTGV